MSGTVRTAGRLTRPARAGPEKVFQPSDGSGFAQGQWTTPAWKSIPIPPSHLAVIGRGYVEWREGQRRRLIHICIDCRTNDGRMELFLLASIQRKELPSMPARGSRINDIEFSIFRSPSKLCIRLFRP